MSGRSHRRSLRSSYCDLYGALLLHFQGEHRMVHLCDGILAMEGEGPGTGGHPRELGALLASFDATRRLIGSPAPSPDSSLTGWSWSAKR